MFDLENAIQNWRRKLRSNPSFEDGDIAELESHLREEIDRLTSESYTEEQAFYEAVEVIGSTEKLAKELKKPREQSGKVAAVTERPRWVPEIIFHYFKIGHRVLLKNPGFTFLNLASLVFGVTGTVLLALYINFTFSFDRFHKNSDSIYRIVREVNTTTEDKRDAITSAPLAPALKRDYPEITAATRVEYGTGLIKKSDQFLEEPVIYTDNDFFKIFSFNLLKGNSEILFNNPGDAYITRAFAQKFFGETGVVNETLPIILNNQTYLFTVTGILEDPPSNSSIQFELVLPFTAWEKAYDKDVTNAWTNNFLTSFIKLGDGVDPANVESKLPGFIESHYKPNAEEMGIGADVSYLDLSLQSLDRMYTDSSVSGSQEPVYNEMLMIVLIVITGIVLFISCFNFINLSIARSFGRGKEIAIRKIMGARRSQVLWQIFNESLLISAITVIISLWLTYTVLPFFNNLTGQSLSLTSIPLLKGFLLIVFITLGIAILAGGYPAIIQSGISIIPGLKNKLEIGGNNLLSKSLIVLQFCVAAVLLIGVILISRQLDYVRNQDLGIDTEQVLVIPLDVNEPDKFASFYKSEIARKTDVNKVTVGSTPMSQWWARRGMNVNGVRFQTYHIKIDPDFLETFDISLKEGRNLSTERTTDTRSSVLVNETFVEKVGWKNPVGKRFQFAGDEVTVAGVVRDFNFISLHYAIGPLVMHMHPSEYYSFLFAEIPRGQAQNLIPTFSEIWTASTTNSPVTYRFLDEQIEQQYAISNNIQKLAGYGSLVGIILACMGLIGMSSLYIARRTREIGIRKVLGATAWDIMRSVFTEYIWLVLIGLIIASPLVYILINQLFQFFAYRIEIGPGPFLLGGIIILVVALVSISTKTIKAGLTNPVNVIQKE